MPLIESLDKLRVLIVDDNATKPKDPVTPTRFVGHDSREADSGSRALELLRKAAADGAGYDLAILDLLMPGMDGFELARGRSSLIPTLPEVHLVLLTSAGVRGDGATARAAGIAAYLTKPVRQSQLFDCLTTVVSTSAGSAVASCSSPATPIKSCYQTHFAGGKAHVQQTHSACRRQHRESEGGRAPVAKAGLSRRRRRQWPRGNRSSESHPVRPRADGLPDARDGWLRSDSRDTPPRRYDKTYANRGDDRARAGRAIARKSLAAGMDDHITKPVKQEELGKLLESIFPDKDHRVSLPAITEPTGPPVDLDRLHEAMGHDPEELLEILGIYLDQMSESLVKLETAVESGNAGEVDLIAHNCAGTSANCGMVAVVEQLRELERMGRENQLAGAGQTLSGGAPGAGGRLNQRSLRNVVAGCSTFTAHPGGR